MKRFLLIIINLIPIYLSMLTLSGQVHLDIQLAKSGTLKQYNFSPYLVNNITSLSITGKIDASDIRFMRDSMVSLAILDLSGVHIVRYSGTEGTLFGKYDIYLDNNIPISSFEKKESLISIILPKTATSIDLFAFAGCKNLTKVLISNSLLLSIGDSAFADCINLSDSLAFPSTITAIGTAAFSGCKNLSVLYFPSSLTLIRQRAFEFCTGLRKIIHKRTIPILVNENIFNGVNHAACSLYVPLNSRCLYHNSPVWKEFSFERRCYSIDVINNNPTYGYVLGEGYHDPDSNVTLTAISYPNCEFLRWSITKSNGVDQWEELVTTDSSFSFTITQDTTFTVHFYGDETNAKEIYSEENNIHIFPNPTNNQLYIETQTSLEEIIMYDISGRIIRQWKKTISPIDISNFPAGVYFVKLCFDKNNAIRKVVKY